MTATDAVAHHEGPATPADDDGGILPPYSGADAVCPKCVHNEAFTWYRPRVSGSAPDEFNGRMRRGPRPERLERECGRCGFKWDEALVVERPGMTIDALAHALDNSLPYPVEIDNWVLKHMANALLGMVRVFAQPDHPLWQYSHGTPAIPATTPTSNPTPEEATGDR